MARNNIIAYPDQLQQPRPNCITCKQSARKHFEAKVEHENDILEYPIIATRTMDGYSITKFSKQPY